MAKKKAKKKKSKKCDWNMQCNSGSGGIWFGGFIGAAIYYISTATGFWTGVLGILKAIVWPVFMVFHLFKFLGL